MTKSTHERELEDKEFKKEYYSELQKITDEELEWAIKKAQSRLEKTMAALKKAGD